MIIFGVGIAYPVDASECLEESLDGGDRYCKAGGAERLVGCVEDVGRDDVEQVGYGQLYRVENEMCKARRMRFAGR